MTGRHHTQHHIQRLSSDQLRAADDAELLALWLSGHREGLDELVTRYHGWMLRLVRQLARGENDPEAVVQDVWLDVMRGAAAFRGEGPVRGWLAAIVRHRVATTWRARDARPQVLLEFLPEDASRPGEVEGQVALRADLAGFLAALPAEQREAIWWVDVVGLSVEETAARLGVAAGTVKSRCHRGRTRLRLRLRARE